MLLKRDPNKKELEQLERRTKKIRTQLDDHKIEPVVVEFAGSPKSGKTTNIEIVHHLFKRMNFTVWAPIEGVSKRTPYHLKKDLVAFNSWSLAYAIQELLVSYHNIDRQDLIMLDRGPFDSLAWMGLLRTKRKLTKGDYGVIKEFALHPTWRTLITRVYLFTCDPKTSLEREHQAKLTKKAGTAMNEKMLSELLERYKELESELRSEKRNHPVTAIDTSRSNSPRKSAFPIAWDICSAFEQKLQLAKNCE